MNPVGLEHRGASEDTLSAIFELLKISVRSLVSEGGELMNGMESMKAIDLSAWVIWTLLEMIKSETASFRYTQDADRPHLQKR